MWGQGAHDGMLGPSREQLLGFIPPPIELGPGDTEVLAFMGRLPNLPMESV
jgi:hypothetical protein